MEAFRVFDGLRCLVAGGSAVGAAGRLADASLAGIPFRTVELLRDRVPDGVRFFVLSLAVDRPLVGDFETSFVVLSVNEATLDRLVVVVNGSSSIETLRLKSIGGLDTIVSVNFFGSLDSLIAKILRLSVSLGFATGGTGDIETRLGGSTLVFEVEETFDVTELCVVKSFFAAASFSATFFKSSTLK